MANMFFFTGKNLQKMSYWQFNFIKYNKNMKKLHFTVSAKKHNDLNHYFNNYFQNQSIENIINLCMAILENQLSVFSLKQINLNFIKLNCNGEFSNNTIFINKRHIKQAKNIQFLPRVLLSLLHEISHALIERNNLKIINNKKLSGPYCAQYNSSKTYNVLLEIFHDEEMAIIAHTYYYRKNPNEMLARKMAHKQVQVFLNKYAQSKNLTIDSFEQQEKQLYYRLLSTFPEIRNFAGLFDKVITDYQKNLIQIGITNLSEQQLDNLLVSTIFCFKDNINDEIIYQLVNCNNIQMLKYFFKEPILKVSSNQKNNLIKTYGTKLIEEIIFKSNIKELSV